MTELLKSYSSMKQDFTSVVKFYGEDSAKMRIDNLFSTFASFTTEFEVNGDSYLLSISHAVCVKIFL